MGKIKDKFNSKMNWYYGPDYDPKKRVLRYDKMVTLEKLNEYDNYRQGNPDDKKILALILGSLGVIGTSGYGVFKLGSHLKSKHDEKKKKEKEKL
ncbi:hypothetical protein [Lysinibacillus xylanilyticus]|uniref:hypothetical protein n=1 Tax=Lysinibacillus xylanilyticus TaxID=582475 RepID=UPI0018E27A19|nr:hypothetical protein [Lysinibacillus xylanilyticus]